MPMIMNPHLQFTLGVSLASLLPWMILIHSQNKEKKKNDFQLALEGLWGVLWTLTFAWGLRLLWMML